MSGALKRVGVYRPAWLWSVIEVAKTAFRLGEVRIGGYQFAPRYDDYAQNCTLCTMAVKDAIRRFNATNDLCELDVLDCLCKKDWQEELDRDYPDLLDRIEAALIELRRLYGSAELVRVAS